MNRICIAICIALMLLIDLSGVIFGWTQRPLTVLIGDLSIAFSAFVLGLTTKKS